MYCHCDETTEIEFHDRTVAGARLFLCPLCQREIEASEVIHRLVLRVMALENRARTVDPNLCGADPDL